ncbi:MAG: NADP-dependent oxidoreductase [Myxococcales bacterium]|nr:NADP-dependent oxidoreductase [Myxococcales bacterium]
MRAVRLHRYGAAEELRLEDTPSPRAGPDDVRVAVRAAAVNPVDFKIRSGAQRAVLRLSLPWTLGMDVSGEVLEVGARVSGFKPGDQIVASPSHRRMGCYADEVVIRADEIALKPACLTHIEAASLPLVALTAWDALKALRVTRSQRILIQAGAGGVGSVAIQLARHLGAEVLTTCSASNVELVRSLGADRAIDYRSEDWRDVARDCDAVLDSLGGDALPDAISTVRRGGRVACITPGVPDFTKRYGSVLGLLVFGGWLGGTMLRARLTRGVSLSVVTRRTNGQTLGEVMRLVESGALRPVIDRVFPLAEAAAAHRYLETGHARGKVVLQP